MRRKRLSAWIAAGVAAGMTTAGPVLAQQAAASTDVAPVAVVGSRAPTAEAPKSATCEYYIRRDPALRAWLSITSNANPSPFALEPGDITPPSLAVPGPKFYLPTRLPRDPDLVSPPRSAPGSPRPALPTKRWVSKDPSVFVPGAQTLDLVQTGADRLSTEVGRLQRVTSAQDNDDIAAGVDACRAQFSRDSIQGSGNAAADGAARYARARIAAKDTNLPMGFALFDEGRFEEALQEFKLAYKKLPDVDGGDEAGLMIGKIYLMALRDKNDPQEAVVWLKKVAGGLFDPVTMMPVFDPREPDRNTAIGEAAMLLGRIYLKGVGPVARDEKEARKWFRRAFNVGHIAAAKAVGDMAYWGVGEPADHKDARAWYARGARFGHAASQFALARMLETGEGGKTDLKMAVAWYNEAAKIDYPSALYALAYAYERGLGVPADTERATGLYKTAALKGDAGAQATIASYFYIGERVDRDLAAARQWFEAAARGGDAEAAFNLAAMMVRGEGGEVDRVKAWSWLNVARMKEHPNAGVALAALEPRMSAEERAAAARLAGGA